MVNDTTRHKTGAHPWATAPPPFILKVRINFFFKLYIFQVYFKKSRKEITYAASVAFSEKISQKLSPAVQYYNHIRHLHPKKIPHPPPLKWVGPLLSQGDLGVMLAENRKSAKFHFPHFGL